jgi:hypothetical protein
MTTLNELTKEWMSAKADERLANIRRITIEEQILKHCEHKEEGSLTTDIGDGIKITTTGKVTYKADLCKLDELTEGWPEEMKPVKVALKLDETVLKKIRKDNPALWKTLARAVEVKPAKTGVSISIEE